MINLTAVPERLEGGMMKILNLTQHAASAKGITRYGSERGEIARIAMRGRHAYIVRTAPAFSPRAGEKTWTPVRSRAAAIDILTDEEYWTRGEGGDWYEEETR